MLISAMLVSVFIAVSSFGLTELLRGTVVKRPFEKGVKPFACNLCMSFWLTFLSSMPLFELKQPLYLVLPFTFGLTLLLLRKYGRRVPPPRL